MYIIWQHQPASSRLKKWIHVALYYALSLKCLSWIRRITTEACCGCCTLSCIGSMYPSESSTSSVSWCTAVWKAKHPSIWPTSASHSPQWHLGSVSDPPADNFWTYRDTDWVLLPDGLSLWQAHRSGTYCHNIWETRPSAKTVSGNS